MKIATVMLDHREWGDVDFDKMPKHCQWWSRDWLGQILYLLKKTYQTEA